MFLDIPLRHDHFPGVPKPVLSNEHVLGPNLDNLTIAIYRWYENNSPGLSEELANQFLFSSFRGRFKFTSARGPLSWNHGRTEALYLLARMPIRFRSVSFYINEDSLSNASSFLGACAQTVRRVLLDAAHCKPSFYSTKTCGLTSSFQSKLHQTADSSSRA